MYVCMYVRSRVQKFPAWHTKAAPNENAVRDFLKGIELLVHRCEKCVEINGDYVEKYQSCFISVTLKSWSGRKLLDRATYVRLSRTHMLFRCLSNLSDAFNPFVYLSVIEQLGNKLDLYSEHAWFKSWLGNCFYRQRCVLPRSFQANTGVIQAANAVFQISSVRHLSAIPQLGRCV